MPARSEEIKSPLFPTLYVDGTGDIELYWFYPETHKLNVGNNTIIPDLIIVKKDNCDILKITIGKKEKTSVANPKGDSTILIDTELEVQELCSLNSAQLRQLHSLGLKLEELFKYPQDIEWAIENNILYALQSRPITTLPKK